jgi:hypothetical protein
MPLSSLIAAMLLAPGVLPASAPWPPGVDLPAGATVDEEYRQQFAMCDADAPFRDHPTRGCSGDANRVTALRRLPGGAIAYVSKLAVDLDGSPFACSPAHGRSDQCPTSLMLPNGGGAMVPVDADRVPYVVIPAAGPADVQGEFGRLTGVGVGDFGVVIARGHVVPVIVADTGPFAKLGEGSLALHRALGRELCVARDAAGICTSVGDEDAMESIGGNVTTVLFPGTARNDLTPATIAATVREQGLALWAAAQARFHGQPSSAR